jgi:hypothetical protein
MSSHGYAVNEGGASWPRPDDEAMRLGGKRGLAASPISVPARALLFLQAGPS